MKKLKVSLKNTKQILIYASFDTLTNYSKKTSHGHSIKYVFTITTVCYIFDFLMTIYLLMTFFVFLYSVRILYSFTLLHFRRTSKIPAINIVSSAYQMLFKVSPFTFCGKNLFNNNGDNTQLLANFILDWSSPATFRLAIVLISFHPLL